MSCFLRQHPHKVYVYVGPLFYFYRLGLLVGAYPWITIACALVVSGIFGIGMLKFKEEPSPFNLWVPDDAEVKKDEVWVQRRFSVKSNTAAMIVQKTNVLTPSGIQSTLVTRGICHVTPSRPEDYKHRVSELFKIYQESFNISKNRTRNFESICQKMAQKCIVASILELWSYNASLVDSLTTADILHSVNTARRSPVYFREFDVTTVLGGIKRDESGAITSAKATIMVWQLQSRRITEVHEWEKIFLQTFLEGAREGFDDVHVYATRSFEDVGAGAIFGDINRLVIGYILMVVYVSLVMGKFSLVHHRIGLSIAGILLIGFAVLFSYGLASICGTVYGPINSILPFLLLGIGVDDMFVIVGAMNSLTSREQTLSLPEQTGLIMKHSGVSITVTSLSDVIAFGIGATTVLPGLRSFCIFASFGILAIYLLELTYFVACLSLDQKRARASRDGCLCCYEHRDYVPSEFSKKDLLMTIFRKFYAPLLGKLATKVIVMAVAVALTSANIWGISKIRQDFDPLLFLPEDSYAFKYKEAFSTFFTQTGVDVRVYCKALDYFGDREKLQRVERAISQNPYIYKGSLSSWHSSFLAWQTDTGNYPVNSSSFVGFLGQYLQTCSGRQHAEAVQFDFQKKSIKATYMSMRYVVLNDAPSEVDAMDSLRQTIYDVFPDKGCFPFTWRYLNWETNKIIKEELFRNMLLAFACVFAVTLLLLADLWMCALVSASVVLSLVNVGGVMWFWGMDVDIVSSVNLIIAIGLTVDYSAHVGHTFMTIPGGRNERIVATLNEMGPAVFNGGFSTFLAFVPLAMSDSYVFTTFFKIFLLVVIFGVFHGLVFLPVVLSWVGPSSYSAPTTGEGQQQDVSNQPTAERQRKQNDALTMDRGS